MTKILNFTLGPSQLSVDVIKGGAIQSIYPRTKDYSEFFINLSKKLQKIFKTNEPVLCITGSGTAAMQMAVLNTICDTDIAHTFNTGTFGHRWTQIIQASNFTCKEHDVQFGNNVTPEQISKLLVDKPDVIFITYNESSSSAICNLKEISQLTKKTDTILVVDAISSLGAEPLEMDNWGCDVVICGSQKFLGVPPGLSFIAFSKKAQMKLNKIKCNTFYFDAKLYLKDYTRGQLPFTAPVTLLNQLNIRLDNLLAEGLEHLREEYVSKTKYLRKNLESLGFSPVSHFMGNCTSAYFIPDYCDAQKFAERLRLEYGIVVVTPHPDSNIIRIGNFANITNSDIEYLINSITKILKSYQ